MSENNTTDQNLTPEEVGRLLASVAIFALCVRVARKSPIGGVLLASLIQQKADRAREKQAAVNSRREPVNVIINNPVKETP